MPEPTTITAITPHPSNPNRMQVKVGNRTAATLPVAAVVDLGLGVGDTWDDTTAARVRDVATFSKVLGAAMKRINRRAMSRRRLAEKLRGDGWEEAVVERVLEKMASVGAIDDEAFGRGLIEEVQARKAAGPALLRVKLRQQGLENRLIESLLREVAENPEADPVADAAELARKKLRSLARLEPVVRKRRLWGLLARRGFNGDVIERALGSLEELRE